MCIDVTLTYVFLLWQAKTDVVPAEQKEEKVAWWVVFLGVLGALIVLAIIIFVFYKVSIWPLYHFSDSKMWLKERTENSLNVIPWYDNILKPAKTEPLENSKRYNRENSHTLKITWNNLNNMYKETQCEWATKTPLKTRNTDQVQQYEGGLLCNFIIVTLAKFWEYIGITLSVSLSFHISCKSNFS